MHALIFAIVVRVTTVFSVVRRRVSTFFAANVACRRASSCRSSLKLVLSHAPALFGRSIAVAVVVVFKAWSSVDAGGNVQEEKSEPPRRRLAVHRGKRWHGVGGTAGDGAGATRRLKRTLSSAAPKYAPKTASSWVPRGVKSGLLEVGGRARSLHPSDCSHTSLQPSSRYSTNARPG